MTRTFLTLFLLIAAGVQLYASDERNLPFATVVRHGDGESFQVRDGALVLLYEKHSSYKITCHISPPPAGLKVESTFNAQSFGGTTTKKNYFIDAQ